MIERTPDLVTSNRNAATTAQIFAADPDSTATIRQAIDSIGLRNAEFIAGNIEAATKALAQRASPRLLIVDISGLEDPVAKVNELAEVCEPNTGVIVIGDRNDIVLYRDLKRAGVAEYFFKPLVGNLVTRTCSTVLNGTTEPQASRTGKLVYMLGVRGGVGSTTIAVNTAWYLAETRQRWVMLVDLDMESGDAALQLDVSPTHALREAFEHPDRVDKLFLERAVIQVDQRIDLLAGLESLADAVRIEEASVLPLLEKLLNRYRYVFVDVPSSAAPHLTQMLQMPSTCVLVSNGTLASARDVARWRDWIGASTANRTTLHILNQHGAAGSLTDVEFTRAAGRAPDMVIPFEQSIGAANTLGIKGAQRNTALKRGLAPLLRHLSGEQADAPRSVLRRLFG